MSNDSEFSTRAWKLILQDNTDKRVSEDSADELGRFAENFAEELALKAIEVAEENGRKTVRDSDIREALNSRRKLVVEEELGIRG